MIALKKYLLAFCCFAGAWSGAWAQASIDGDWIDRLAEEDDWVSWVDALGRPETVNKLYIKNLAELDTAVLKTFHHLTGLIIVDSPLPSLDFLKYYPDLTVFECQGNKLRSLKGIEVLTKAEAITIKANFVKDVHPLDSLLHLKMLNLSDNDISNISSLSHLEHITHLDLGKNRIRDLEAIRGWRQLEFLSVYGCYELSDIGPVADFRNLRSLNLGLLDIPGFSISLLDSIPGLEILQVQGMVHGNAEVAHIAKHLQLKELTMGQNDKVTDVSGLAPLVQLEYLDIHSNNVSEISVVSYMPRLIKLVMYKNHVKDLRPLGECLGLRALFLFENPVENFEVLYDLPKLQHLHVDRSAFDKESAAELRVRLPDTEISFM